MIREKIYITYNTEDFHSIFKPFMIKDDYSKSKTSSGTFKFDSNHYRKENNNVYHQPCLLDGLLS